MVLHGQYWNQLEMCALFQYRAIRAALRRLDAEGKRQDVEGKRR
jgi:hypothetical protein